jgi:hypothetical protein
VIMFAPASSSYTLACLWVQEKVFGLQMIVTGVTGPL